MININKILFVFIISLFCLTKSNALIQDSIFATVGNKAITQSDIVNEIKITLILNGQSFSEDQRKRLETGAIKMTIKRAIKKIEVDKYESLEFNQADLDGELNRLAAGANMDLDTLKSVFIANGIDFSNVIDQVRIELLWNSLIFELYKNRLSINIDEIDEQLKSIELEKKIKEYLLSEIIIESVSKEKIESRIEEVQNKIKTEGFEKVARDLSISETSTKGGNLGWISENIISEDFKSNISNTLVGNVTEPIFLPTGILFLKIRDKRELKEFIDLEDAKNQLVNAEKTKILNLHSLSHYDKLKRSIAINYFE